MPALRVALMGPAGRLCWTAELDSGADRSAIPELPVTSTRSALISPHEGRPRGRRLCGAEVDAVQRQVGKIAREFGVRVRADGQNDFAVTGDVDASRRFPRGDPFSTGDDEDAPGGRSVARRQDEDPLFGASRPAVSYDA